MTFSGYLIRPISMSDLDNFYALSELTGVGFTSLQADKEFLEKLITKSLKSFAAPKANATQTFVLVMEAIESGDIIGCTSIKTSIGSEGFKCADFEMLNADRVPVLDPQFAKTLVLKRTFTGYAEVGSLFLDPAYRAFGLGRFLARSRYMFMGTRPDIFSQPVVAQLRGCCDETNASPFYSSVWKDRLGKDYEETDLELANAGAGFCLDQFFNLELTISSLGDAAVSAIGTPHKTASGALRLLLQEGFSLSSYVDLSDGGPITLAYLSDLVCTHASPAITRNSEFNAYSDETVLITTQHLESFRGYVGKLEGTQTPNNMKVPSDAVASLNCGSDAALHISGLSSATVISTPASNVSSHTKGHSHA